VIVDDKRSRRITSGDAAPVEAGPVAIGWFGQDRHLTGYYAAAQTRAWTQELRRAATAEFSFIELPGAHTYSLDGAREVLGLIGAESVDG
jgi:hypothetical protein